MNLIEIIAVMEIIAVNMLVIRRCCHRRYCPPVNIAVLGAFTLLVLGIGYFVVSKFAFYGNGNGFFVIFGFLYLIPLGFLYQESRFELFVIICMAWVYTLGVFALAVQAGKLAEGADFQSRVLLIETLLFLFGTAPFNRLVVGKYIYILENARKENHSWDKYLAATSIIHFFTMMCVNFVFSIEKGHVLKVLAMLLLITNMFFTYNVLYIMVRHKNQARELNKTVHHDDLTGLRNRLSLFDDLQRMLQSEETFTVLFMDLDKFKSINDKYGHVVGDKYLVHFAETTQNIIGDAGVMYRFGGDEFIAVCPGRVSDELLMRLRECREWEKEAPCPFNHVSIGAQLCEPPHMNVEELLAQVDQRMYAKKAKTAAAESPAER